MSTESATTGNETQLSVYLRHLIAFIAIGAALYLGSTFWAGWHEILASLQRIGASVLCMGGALASTAYLWRYLRWRFCLRHMGYDVPLWRDLKIYLSGLALTTSPGKVGETIRSLLLLPHQVKATHSVGAFLADRLSDVIGVCLLGVVASTINEAPDEWLLGIALVLLVTAFAISFGLRRSYIDGAWIWLERRVKWLRIRAGLDIMKSWSRLWQGRRVALFILIAGIAYGTQGAVFYWLCTRLDIAISMATAIEIFVNATLIGAASMVPGGLGPMEASLVFQLSAMGVENATAISIAIASRLLTLWLGIFMGTASLLSVSRGFRL